MSAVAATLRADAKVIGLVSAAHMLSHFALLVVPSLFFLMTEEFGVGFAALGLAMSMLSVMSGLFQTVGGFLVDRFGGKRVLIGGMAIISSGLVLVGLAPSYPMLVLALMVTGFGNSAFHPADFAILNAKVDAQRLGYAFSAHGVSGNIGFALAPLFAVSLGALIFENSPVVEIIHNDTPVVVTEHGRITANSVILAGNAYHKLERGKLGGMIFPASGGIVTTKPLGAELAASLNPHDLAVYDCRFVLDYYRMTADKRLLFGGGTNYSGRDSRDIAGELRPAIEHTFPQLKGVEIEFQWSGMMGIVINRIPQLGKLSKNVWYAQGYSGHGVATTHIVGEIMANAVSGSMEKFDTFAGVSHIRLPVGAWLGNQMMAVGMWYYQLLERLR